MRLIPRMFSFDEVLPADLELSVSLTKHRVPEMARYVLNNPGSYTFSALTASIDAEVKFEAIADSGDGHRLGVLHVPMDAKFIINDGQHRRPRSRWRFGKTLTLTMKRSRWFLPSTSGSSGANRCLRISTGMLFGLQRRSDCFMTTGTKWPLWQSRWRFSVGGFKGLVEFEKSSLSLRSASFLR